MTEFASLASGVPHSLHLCSKSRCGGRSHLDLHGSGIGCSAAAAVVPPPVALDRSGSLAVARKVAMLTIARDKTKDHGVGLLSSRILAPPSVRLPSHSLPPWSRCAASCSPPCLIFLPLSFPPLHPPSSHQINAPVCLLCTRRNPASHVPPHPGASSHGEISP